MAIAKAKPSPKAPAPVTGRCSLRLRINGTTYAVRPIPAGFAATRAFRLTKPGGETHDVSQLVYGHECTCGDFVFRRDGIDPGGCKHVKAAVACGLLDARGGAR
jgi:hypothetical protein